MIQIFHFEPRMDVTRSARVDVASAEGLPHRSELVLGMTKHDKLAAPTDAGRYQPRAIAWQTLDGDPRTRGRSCPGGVDRIDDDDAPPRAGLVAIIGDHNLHDI